MGYNLSGLPGEGPEMGPPAPGLGRNSATGGGGDGLPLAPIAIGGAALLNYIGGQQANSANSAEAAANRAFAAEQAGIARDYDQAKTIWQATHGYQNAVQDMTKAGLNPAMMFKGMQAESGSGGGGSPASAPGNPVHTNAIAPGLTSAVQAASLLNDLRNSDADIALKQAQTLTQAATATRENAAAQQMTEDTYQTTMKRSKTAAEAARDASQATIDKNYQYNKNLGWFLGQTANAWNSAASTVKNSGVYKDFQKWWPQIKSDIQHSDIYRKVMP